MIELSPECRLQEYIRHDARSNKRVIDRCKESRLEFENAETEKTNLEESQSKVE